MPEPRQGRVVQNRRHQGIDRVSYGELDVSARFGAGVGHGLDGKAVRLPGAVAATAITGCNGAQSGCRDPRAASYVNREAICQACTAVLTYPGGDLSSTVAISAEAVGDPQRDLAGRGVTI